MARPYGVIGIDLGTDSTKAVFLEAVRGEDQPRVAAVSVSLSQGIRKGVIFEPDQAALSLRKALDALSQATEGASARSYISIGGIGLGFQKSRGLIAISRADGEVSGEDIRRAVAASETNLSRVQNREILHKIPLLYYVDNDTVTHDPLGLSGIKLEAETLFITMFSHHTKAVLKALDEAQVEVEELAATPFALSHAVFSKREKEVGVMALDIGAATTSLVIFEEGLPYSLEVIPWGSAHITHDIAMGFQISIDEAEKLKINHGAVTRSVSPGKKEDTVYGNYSKKKLSEIIEARLNDIFELVEKHLKKVDRTGLLPAGVVLVGGGANLPGIDSFVREYLKLPVRIGSPEHIGGFKDKVNNPAWAGAVGVALMGLSQKGGAPMFRGKSGVLLRWLRTFLP
ncbi:cell division protein FtsA [Candidatus Giovannonibacteria bacterium RIFCSPHIGHO2_02_FULL_46_20]|uniref:Cell division protein FtsA n=1 Tax=Candidatus Giovannonibacteria bacterium RIFCSPHIGHO2_02_FULL_46_20 TaxID=1798338 RepID=A0A1F5WGS3_9BACT|nr:MAG: cell division protein FtsA [Candidatus Giovannonibacteria bacterium RIFCSPHIGHO2_02_FULL_46_20]